MELIGKPAINPLVFYSGKVSGYTIWVAFVYLLINNGVAEDNALCIRCILACIVFASGLVIAAISLIHLGKSVRLGVPSESTLLKTKGIYTLSRNPMYVGFALFTLASMIYTMSVVAVVLGVYSLVVYHLIILSEEKFLTNRFGSDFEHYKERVGRYFSCC